MASQDCSKLVEVMKAFPPDDRAGDLRNLDLNFDSLSIQRSFDVCWDTQKESLFFFKEDYPYTRRELLSVINSLYWCNPLANKREIFGGTII